MILSITVSDWFVALPFIAALFFAWYCHARIRCPQCDRQIHSHTVPLDAATGRKQIYYDCPECCVRWDPDVIIQND